MSNHSEPFKPKRWRPQISLLTILLLMGVAAVWLALYRSQQELERRRTELDRMKKIARELVVDDPSQLCIVSPHITKFGENIWRIYIPPNSKRKLCLAMGDVEQVNQPRNDTQENIDPNRCRSLPSGVHELELVYSRGEAEGSKSILVLTLNDKELLRRERDYDWEPQRGSKGGNRVSELRSLPDDQAVTLFHRRFAFNTKATKATANTQAVTEPELGPGIKVWITADNRSGVH